MENKSDLLVVNSDGEVFENNEIQVTPSKFSREMLEMLVNNSINLDEKNPIMDITGKYYEFAKAGDKVRGVFAGFKTIEKKEVDGLKPIKCVEWVTNGQFFMNGETVLVNEIEKFGVAIGQPIEIEYNGKRGNAKMFTIRLLG